MRFTLFIVFIFIFVPYLRAQDSADTKYKVAVTVNAGYDIGSNAFTNKFYQAFYNGEHLTKELKDDVNDRTKNMNRLGGDLNYGTTVTFKPDSLRHLLNHFQFTLGLHERTHAHIGFTNNAYQLVFFGNQPYAGSNLSLNNSQIHYLQYQQIRGAMSNTSDSSNGTYTIGFSYINGNKNLYVLVPTLDINTSQDLTLLTIDADYQLSQAGLNYRNYFYSAGNGFSFDVNYQKKYRLKRKDKIYPCTFNFNMSDIGFIKWKHNSKTALVDTSINWQGVYITNLTLKDTNTTYSGDSLKSTFLPYKLSSYSSALPSIIKFENEFICTDKITLTLFLQHRIFAVYKPLFGIITTQKLSKIFSVSYGLTFGGYNKASLLGGLVVKLCKNFDLSISSNHLEGYILPARTGAQGLFINLNTRF